jgi:hypothetical protein
VLKNVPSDQNSSLLRTFVYCSRKTFYNIG